MAGPPAAGAPAAGTRQNAQSSDWNFLRGEGPSHVSMYYADDKDKGRFKPGWTTMRHEADIKPDALRVQQEQYQAARAAGTSDLRRNMLDSQTTYNPITGQQRPGGAGGQWSECTNPWQHQKVGLKSVAPPSQEASRQVAQSGVVQLRKDRMATEGMAPTRPGGSVKDALQWH